MFSYHIGNCVKYRATSTERLDAAKRFGSGSGHGRHALGDRLRAAQQHKRRGKQHKEPHSFVSHCVSSLMTSPECRNSMAACSRTKGYAVTATSFGRALTMKTHESGEQEYSTIVSSFLQSKGARSHGGLRQNLRRKDREAKTTFHLDDAQGFFLLHRHPLYRRVDLPA